jgi:hypothetical protein
MESTKCSTGAATLNSPTISARMFKYSWQETVIDAAREFNPPDLSAKLKKAETTVQARITALSENGNGSEEHQALLEAVDVLRKLGRHCDSR